MTAKRGDAHEKTVSMLKSKNWTQIRLCFKIKQYHFVVKFLVIRLYRDYLKLKAVFMNKKKKNITEDKKGERLRMEAKISNKMPGRNISEKSDIEQTRLENRREADLEDKTPAGDSGPEDNKNKRANDPIGESNY
jgi:hypothetical protein